MQIKPFSHSAGFCLIKTSPNCLQLEGTSCWLPSPGRVGHQAAPVRLKESPVSGAGLLMEGHFEAAAEDTAAAFTNERRKLLEMMWGPLPECPQPLPHSGVSPGSRVITHVSQSLVLQIGCYPPSPPWARGARGLLRPNSSHHISQTLSQPCRRVCTELRCACCRKNGSKHFRRKQFPKAGQRLGFACSWPGSGTRPRWC